MEAFPCPLELTAATALLLLSSSPPSLSSNSSSSCFEEFFCNDSSNSSSKDDSSSSISKSSSSTFTNERSSEEILAHRMRVLASAARFHEIKRNVVRSRRSKNYRNSDRRKIPSFEWSKSETFTPVSVSEVTEPSSLSSASSTTSCRMVRVEKKWPGLSDEKMRRIKIGPASLRRRAETILKLLSLIGCACEGRIRGKLGDTPDTSKALRMLLRLEEVKRSGAGGRFDPFTYTVMQCFCFITLKHLLLLKNTSQTPAHLDSAKELYPSVSWSHCEGPSVPVHRGYSMFLSCRKGKWNRKRTPTIKLFPSSGISVARPRCN